ncbi:MAG TPA: alcohol dehydrogenase catalytic domain-containing protein, partial [Thermoplasmata archaeon]|nr:alcohol dehydrogenase catalytic domain-containing protein [Thermoplasmata archaeon]
MGKEMVLHAAGSPLVLEDRPDLPDPGPTEVRLRVLACGVCRTDLHLLDGDLPLVKRPVIPGHEIVGTVEAVGPRVTRVRVGVRVGVPWLGGSCGGCGFCRTGRENLCDQAVFTGYSRDGGYAEEVLADAAFVFPIPSGYSDLQAAPLLCAGMIGYR